MRTKVKEKIEQIATLVPRSSVAEEYYFWLCDIINVNQRHKAYWLLAKALHGKAFYWSVPNDDNRAFEAKNLREMFCMETNRTYVYEDFNDEASMLELLISLATRCESIMVDQEENMDVKGWFWKLLSNVGLDKFTDDAYYDGRLFTIDDILNRIIDRTYKRNGVGGLFPLRHPKKDQRKVELWYQMSEYLVENYYSEDVYL